VYSFVAVLDKDKRVQVIAKLASAILAAAGIALAMAPPAIADDEKDYLSQLLLRGVPAGYVADHELMLNVGNRICNKMNSGLDSGILASILEWEFNTNRAETEPRLWRRQAEIIVSAAHEHLCPWVEDTKPGT
jgi:hypothetical protein